MNILKRILTLTLCVLLSVSILTGTAAAENTVSEGDSMVTYEGQCAWENVQSFLPDAYHFTDDYMPTEEVWEWKGNQIHLDTFRNPDAPAKVICFHGVGTNGRQISMIIGGPLARDGFETICIDMPTYGVTKTNPDMLIKYDDWVQCGSDLIDAELQKDDRPIFLYGLSAGGMETYHVAAKNRSDKIKGIIGMTFLDQRKLTVRVETANNKISGFMGRLFVGLNCLFGNDAKKMKMSDASKMTALVNDPDCLKAMMDDPTSAGNSATYAFLYSYMTYAPDVEPRKFDVCPILLTQPEKDQWTPQRLSDMFLKNIKKVSVTKTVLTNGSHYPIEAEALTQLHDHCLDFIQKQLAQ